MSLLEKHVEKILKQMQGTEWEKEEIKEELLSHLNAAKEEYLSQGMTEIQAEKQALADFERIGLPTNKTEEYKYTPLSRLLEKNFSFAVDNAPSALTDVKNFFIPEVEGHILVYFCLRR